MGAIENLEKILKSEVLIQVDAEIAEIQKILKKQKNNTDLENELEYMKDVKKYYEEVIVHIEKKILSEEDAANILQDLEDMIDDEDEV